MRRILRKVAEGDVGNLGDISTLLDPGVVDQIVKGQNQTGEVFREHHQMSFAVRIPLDPAPCISIS